MKGVIGLALAFALTLSVVPAIAGDTFHAFSTLPAAARASLAPMPDAQLAAVEGKYLDILNLLCGILPLASIGNSTSTDHGLVINIQSIFQMQWDTGGAIHTNMVEVRQQ
jgi:hypothetical protein